MGDGISKPITVANDKTAGGEASRFKRTARTELDRQKDLKKRPAEADEATASRPFTWQTSGPVPPPPPPPPPQEREKHSFQHEDGKHKQGADSMEVECARTTHASAHVLATDAPPHAP